MTWFWDYEEPYPCPNEMNYYHLYNMDTGEDAITVDMVQSDGADDHIVEIAKRLNLLEKMKGGPGYE